MPCTFWACSHTRRAGRKRRRSTSSVPSTAVGATIAFISTWVTCIRPWAGRTWPSPAIGGPWSCAHQADAHCNLGAAYYQREQLAEAAACYQRTLELQPDSAQAHYNLGKICHEEDRLSDAVACYRRALAVNPDYVEAHNNLGIVWQDMGELSAAAGCYRRALEIDPDNRGAQHNALDCGQYCEDVTLQRLAAAHRAWGLRQATAGAGARLCQAATPDPRRRLRLGLVSADFGTHPVGFFVIAALENLPAAECEIVCYSNRPRAGELAARFRTAAHVWRDVQAWTDEALSRQIRADGIDILFDLAGHTAGNRLPVFAGEAGPGASDVGRLPRHHRADGHGLHPGRPLRDSPAGRALLLRDGAADARRLRVLQSAGLRCGRGASAGPAAGLPDVGQLQQSGQDHAARGGVWADILRRVANSRLVLKFAGMDDVSVAGRLQREFAGRGIDPQRVRCAGR